MVVLCGLPGPQEKDDFARRIGNERTCALHPQEYRIAGIFRGYTFSRMDLYKGFLGFYFRGLSSSLLAHAHINMQLYLHTVSLESRPNLYESLRHYVLHL